MSGHGALHDDGGHLVPPVGREGHAVTPGVRHPGFGITPGILLLVLLAILASIMQGSFVADAATAQFSLASPFGRVWPSLDSAKIQLPPKAF